MGGWIRWVGDEVSKKKEEKEREGMRREWYLRKKDEEREETWERACLPEREGSD